MALRRDELLGSTLLLWIGAGLLALYLLCNPGAADLQEQLGAVRLWGAVLGLVSLGLALPGEQPLLWLLPLLALPLLLPVQISRRIWPAIMVGNAGLALLGLRQRKRRRGGIRSKGRARSWRRPPRRSAYSPGRDAYGFRSGRGPTAGSKHTTKGGDSTGKG